MGSLLRPKRATGCDDMNDDDNQRRVGAVEDAYSGPRLRELSLVGDVGARKRRREPKASSRSACPIVAFRTA
jgi:hypothetical protein